MRAASFALSTALIALALTAALLVSWRLKSEHAVENTVRLVIDQEAKPPPAPPSRRPPPSVRAPATGTPTATDIPSQQGLAQALVCFGPNRRDHPECLDLANPALAASGPPISTAGHYAPPPSTRVLTTADRPIWQGIPPDPCAPGGHGQVCFRFPDPPPPSHSPEEICEAGLIGPCHPPAFRPEDVVHKAHSD
jgi:hypothetical protein